MRHLKLIVAALSVCALSACVIAPYPRQAGYYPEPSGVIVSDVAPPAPYAEVMPVVPFPARSGSAGLGLVGWAPQLDTGPLGPWSPGATPGTRTAGKAAADAGICRAAAGAGIDLGR